NLRRILTIVAVPNPRWAHANVDQAGPGESARAVGVDGVVRLLHSLQLLARGLVGDALVLDRPLVALCETTEHERELRVPAQIRCFARRGERVENDLELVGDGDADDGSLRGQLGRYRRLHRETMLAEERQEAVRVHQLTPSREVEQVL